MLVTVACALGTAAALDAPVAAIAATPAIAAIAATSGRMRLMRTRVPDACERHMNGTCRNGGLPLLGHGRHATSLPRRFGGRGGAARAGGTGGSGRGRGRGAGGGADDRSGDAAPRAEAGGH